MYLSDFWYCNMSSTLIVANCHNSLMLTMDSGMALRHFGRRGKFLLLVSCLLQSRDGLAAGNFAFRLFLMLFGQRARTLTRSRLLMPSTFRGVNIVGDRFQKARTRARGGMSSAGSSRRSSRSSRKRGAEGLEDESYPSKRCRSGRSSRHSQPESIVEENDEGEEMD